MQNVEEKGEEETIKFCFKHDFILNHIMCLLIGNNVQLHIHASKYNFYVMIKSQVWLPDITICTEFKSNEFNLSTVCKQALLFKICQQPVDEKIYYIPLLQIYATNKLVFWSYILPC